MDQHSSTRPKSAQVVVGEKGQDSHHASTTGDVTRSTNATVLNSTTRVRKVFSHLQIFFFALSFMSSWEAMGTNIGVIFYNGGPRAMIWGFFIVIPGTLCQVASMSEMASMQPIAGAQYVWTHHYAPARYRRGITWIQGWITWFSWIAITAGSANVAGNIISTLITIQWPGYAESMKAWHTTLIMFAFLIPMGLLNAFVFWVIPWIEMAAGILHVVLFIVFAAVLISMGQRSSADFVFFEKANLSGWNNDFVSFNLGIILITWGFVGFDAAIHMSEEVRKSRHAIPRAMFWSICMNGALAFAMTLIYLFYMGSVDDVLGATYGLVPIVLNATRSIPATVALMSCFLVTVITVMLGCVASSSRLTWSWARDGALPAYFGHVDKRFRVPLRSLWLSILIIMILCLLNLVSAVAIGIVISLGTFGLFQSYFIAIACAVHARLTGRFETAPWSLGRFGLPINIVGLVYTAWVGVFLVFPNYLPIDGAYMNYALPINVGVWLFAGVTWFVWARKHWGGINRQILDVVLEDADRDTKE